MTPKELLELRAWVSEQLRADAEGYRLGQMQDELDLTTKRETSRDDS